MIPGKLVTDNLTIEDLCWKSDVYIDGVPVVIHSHPGMSVYDCGYPCLVWFEEDWKEHVGDRAVLLRAPLESGGIIETIQQGIREFKVRHNRLPDIVVGYIDLSYDGQHKIKTAADIRHCALMLYCDVGKDPDVDREFQAKMAEKNAYHAGVRALPQDKLTMLRGKNSDLFGVLQRRAVRAGEIGEDIWERLFAILDGAIKDVEGI